MDIVNLYNYALLAFLPFGGNMKFTFGELAVYLIVAIPLMFVLYIAVRWINYRSPKKLPYPGPVSVIICAHNEAENLRSNLPAVLRQRYAEYEVIVVNDHSTDLSAEVLEIYQRRFGRLQVINLKSAEANKKRALHAGIHAAKYDIVLLTDADCRPATLFWIETMGGFFDEATDIVLGFSPYHAQPGLLNKLIRYETLYTAFLYGGLAMMGLPYMGVGRNLAYRKKIYLNATANNRFAAVLSGDDDLLVNEMANSTNTRVCAENDALTWSQPKTTWRAWWHQKRRHREAGNFYTPRTKATLALVYLPQLFFYAAILALVLKGLLSGTAFLGAVLLLLLVRFVMLIVMLPATMNALEQASLLPFVLVCDFLMSLFLFSLGCLSAIKVRTWTNYHPHNAHKKTSNW